MDIFKEIKEGVENLEDKIEKKFLTKISGTVKSIKQGGIDLEPTKTHDKDPLISYKLFCTYKIEGEKEDEGKGTYHVKEYLDEGRALQSILNKEQPEPTKNPNLRTEYKVTVYVNDNNIIDPEHTIIHSKN